MMMPSEWERERRARNICDLFEKEIKKYLEGFEETILKSKEFLKRKKFYQEEGSFDWQDTKAWVEVWDKNTEAMIVYNYNMDDWRFLFLIEKNSRGTVISCYRLYADLYDGIETKKPLHYIEYADSIFSFYTDNIEGSRFVSRPNLAYFKEHYKEFSTEKTFHFQPLFQITKLKKSFLSKLKNIEKLFQMQEEMGFEKPIEKDGYVIVYEAKDAVINYKEINFACLFMCRILESKEYA